MQLYLFDDTTEDAAQEDEKNKKCIECSAIKPVEEFPLRSDGGFRRTVCKKCTYNHNKTVKQLREQNPPPDEKTYICPVCQNGYEQSRGKGGKHFSTWVLDHCHKTMTFRGYLCHNCNKGVFRDDIELYERKLEYLKKHEDQLKAEGLL